MEERDQIDITYDFRTDAHGRDPDRYSPTLRRYHKLLWSKPLPCGEVLDLSDTSRGHYLLHRSDERGEFSLSSDAVVASYKYVPMVKQEEEALREFLSIAYTMGGMMLWPGRQVDGKWTINQARGCRRRVRDRFDLTVECIRRYYLDEWSPLSEDFARYAGFLGLFVDFRGFVEFFLLQDAVTVDCDAVIFSAPFDDFATSPIPKTMEEYREYRQRAIAFIEARNRRILRWCSEDRAGRAAQGSKSVPGAVPLQTPPAGVRSTLEDVLELAGQYGTRKALEQVMAVAARKGLPVRPFKTCLMITPPSNRTRCLFTIWAEPGKGGLSAYVAIEGFTMFFPLERAVVEGRLGPDGWRTLDKAQFDDLLGAIEGLNLGS